MTSTSTKPTPENTITVELPAVKLEFDLSEITFEVLDKMIFDIVREMGRKIFEQILVKLDDRLNSERVRGRYRNDGFRCKYLQTMVGEIRY